MVMSMNPESEALSARECSSCNWQLPHGASARERFDRLLAVVQRTGAAELAGRAYVNSAVGYEWRGLTVSDDWAEAYVLTPWMLARAYVPLSNPSIPLPAGWEAQVRAQQPFQLIGPAMVVVLGEEMHRLHLQWLPGYGHLLLQPLVQNLPRFTDAAEVWAAWDGVLAARDRGREARLAALQQQNAALDRREFLRRMIGAS
ncbi:MAG: [NiFe]-hydrogenase assembly chaperone HybE [Acidihalobacter sp.]